MARIELRIADETKIAWEAKAEQAGLTLSDLVRHAVDGIRTRRRNRVSVDPALIRELARIGNNLNQLARWVNRDRSKVEAVAVIARLVEIDRELAAIRQAVEAPDDAD